MKFTFPIYSLLLASFLSVVSPTIFAQQTFSDVYTLFAAAQESGDTKLSVKYAQDSLILGAEEFGKQSENTANLQYNLALAYYANNQPKEAFSLFEDVVDNYEELYGESSIARFNVMLDQLAVSKIYAHKKEKRTFSRVQRSYKGLVRDLRKTLKSIADKSPEEAVLLQYNFASVMNAAPLNNYLFTEAFRITRTTEAKLLAQFGKTDSRTIEMQFMLARYLKAKKRNNEAIEYFEKVVTAINDELDTSHPYELASHARFVELYEARGQSEDATKHCVAIGEMTPWNANARPMPLYRVNPQWPSNISRDGKVILGFVIDNFGFVKEIELIESSSASFEKSAIKALGKWRYAPKIINGEAVISEQLKVRIDFNRAS